MPTSTDRERQQANREQRARDALKAAEEAACRLQAALAFVGVKLPSLRAVTTIDGLGHVELGGCPTRTAAQLADLLGAAAPALRKPLPAPR